MNEAERIRYLRIALRVIGAVFLFGLYPLMLFWSSSWTWEPRQYEYEWMILGVYAVLGFFLLLASRNPLQHLSLIWFTVWSSVVHGAIMLAEAILDPVERANLLGDVPALFLVALVLAILTPRRLAPPARAA